MLRPTLVRNASTLRSATCSAVATSSACRVGKCRNSAPWLTPASAQTAAVEVAAYPRSARQRTVASRSAVIVPSRRSACVRRFGVVVTPRVSHKK